MEAMVMEQLVTIFFLLLNLVDATRMARHMSTKDKRRLHSHAPIPAERQATCNWNRRIGILSWNLERPAQSSIPFLQEDVDTTLTSRSRVAAVLFDPTQGKRGSFFANAPSSLTLRSKASHIPTDKEPGWTMEAAHARKRQPTI